jgi:hypothetical protein
MAFVSCSSCYIGFDLAHSLYLVLLFALLSAIVRYYFSFFKRMIKISSRCPCCPCKRRKKRPLLDEFPQEDSSVQSPIYPHIVYNPFENSLNLDDDDDDLSSSTRPSSVTSSRNADDIQLTGLTSPRTEKPKPQYALPLQRSPRVAPASLSPDAYVYGSRQASKINLRQ